MPKPAARGDDALRAVSLDFMLNPDASVHGAAPIARGAFGFLSAEKPAPAPDTDALDLAATLIAGAGDAAQFAPDPDAAALLRCVSHDLALMHAPTISDAPMARADAAAAMVNLRRGALDLSMLYGPDETPMPGLRDPGAPARMLTPHDCAAPEAMSADPRNHLTPALSRLHRALINLHNMAVEDCDDPGLAALGADALFGYARAELRQLMQWLTMNRALPALCPPAAIAAVADGRAPLFARMGARMGGGVPPVPLEALMGALPLITLGEHAATRSEIAALLQLGRRMALPSGQESVRAINRALGTRLAPLTDAEICAGPAAATMTADMRVHTPLWLYLLRESKERGVDGRLGPVGGHIAAQSIAGLIVSDPYSYWLRPGATGGRWRPEDGVLRVGGRPIDSIAALMAAADL
jgi:hypothetical protein